jgi:hypothetical protein
VFYVLDLRASNVGGAVVPGRLVRGTEIDLRQHADVTFLLHGFNVSRNDGIAALDRFASSLPSVADHALVAVLWPGDHWARALSYSFEGKDADDSAQELVRYIDRILLPGTTLSFASHSLGARVVLQTIRGLIHRPYQIGEVCLMAPAVDDYCLAHPNVYRAAAAAAARLTILASHKDQVLRLAYPVGDLLQAFIFFRRDMRGLALGYHGPRPFKESPVGSNVLHEQIPDARNVGHGDYLPAGQANEAQRSATAYADAALSGGRPRYP